MLGIFLRLSNAAELHRVYPVTIAHGSTRQLLDRLRLPDPEQVPHETYEGRYRRQYL